MVVALLTAAGIGSRMGQDIPKQFMHVENKPIIVYTMEAFQRHPAVDAILVVTLPSWGDILRAYAKQFNITKLRWIVPGGKTNPQSIYFGLRKLREEQLPDDAIVIVHDGNRASVTSEIISNNLSTYQKYGDATCAIPCTEAVFESEDQGQTSTVSIPREKLIRIQTPITYPLKDIYEAYELAEKNHMEASCILINERRG